MNEKTFTVVTTCSMILTLTVALLSIIGVAITGFYPGIVVLSLMAVVPIATRAYASQNAVLNSGRRHYTTLTMLNLLSILVVLWMTFVIVHDRVLHDCC